MSWADRTRALLDAGKTTAEIGTELGVKPRTARLYVCLVRQGKLEPCANPKCRKPTVVVYLASSDSFSRYCSKACGYAGRAGKPFGAPRDASTRGRSLDEVRGRLGAYGRKDAR